MGLKSLLLFPVFLYCVVRADDLGFLGCQDVTLEQEKWEDWYVVSGEHGRLLGNNYSFDFLVDSNAKFVFDRVDENEPYFYITYVKDGQKLFVYMTDTEDKSVESVDAEPGTKGQWKVTRVEDGKYTLSPKELPDWFMCMSGDFFGTIKFCHAEAGPEGTFSIKNR